jgi:hypothetical protein
MESKGSIPYDDRNFISLENGPTNHTEILTWQRPLRSPALTQKFKNGARCALAGPLILVRIHRSRSRHQGETKMRRSQGRHFSSQEIDRIKSLLSSTDLSLQEIATRMDCAKSSVVSINQIFRIREYRGRRRYWDCPISDSSIRTTEEQAHTMSGLAD